MSLKFYLITLTAFFKKPSTTNSFEDHIIMAFNEEDEQYYEGFKKFKFEQFAERMHVMFPDQIQFFSIMRHPLPKLSVFEREVASSFDEEMTQAIFTSLLGEVLLEVTEKDPHEERHDVYFSEETSDDLPRRWVSSEEFYSSVKLHSKPQASTTPGAKKTKDGSSKSRKIRIIRKPKPLA